MMRTFSQILGHCARVGYTSSSLSNAQVRTSVFFPRNLHTRGLDIFEDLCRRRRNRRVQRLPRYVTFGILHTHNFCWSSDIRHLHFVLLLNLFLSFFFQTRFSKEDLLSACYPRLGSQSLYPNIRYRDGWSDSRKRICVAMSSN